VQVYQQVEVFGQVQVSGQEEGYRRVEELDHLGKTHRQVKKIGSCNEWVPDGGTVVPGPYRTGWAWVIGVRESYGRNLAVAWISFLQGNHLVHRDRQEELVHNWELLENPTLVLSHQAKEK
jgi:hypothetical protein